MRYGTGRGSDLALLHRALPASDRSLPLPVPYRTPTTMTTKQSQPIVFPPFRLDAANQRLELDLSYIFLFRFFTNRNNVGQKNEDALLYARAFGTRRPYRSLAKSGSVTAMMLTGH